MSLARSLCLDMGVRTSLSKTKCDVFPCWRNASWLNMLKLEIFHILKSAVILYSNKITREGLPKFTV